MPNFTKNLTIWLIVGVLLVVLFNLFQGGIETGGHDRLAFSDFLIKVNSGEVADVMIKKAQDAPSTTIVGHYTGTGERFITYAPEYPSLVEVLSQKKVRIYAAPDNSGMEAVWSALLSWFPLLLLIGVYVFFMRQMQSREGGRGGALGFGKSRARLLTEKTEKITFEDVAGIDEAKEELSEIVDSAFSGSN